MVFSERYSIYGKNGAIKYITHLDKFSYFPKHYNFHDIMLYSQYPPKTFKSKFVFSQTTGKYSDEMTVSQNNFNCAQKLSIIDVTRFSVSCFVCIEIIVFTLFA